MSRLVVFDLDNHSVGEFSAKCNRGYMVYGNPGVDGAGSTTVVVPDEVAEEKWLQLGRMVLVQRSPLPAWVGVIDTPWKVTLPVELTLYNTEYLFSLRSPEQSILFSGPVSGIVKHMINIMNQQEDLHLSLGEVSGPNNTREETLDRRDMWSQLVPLLERSGHEMILRPVVDAASNQLKLFADVGVGLGIDTGFLLHDGEQANMRVVDARLDGQVLNRLMGVSGESTAEEQLETAVLEDQDSQDVYRTRSATLQFRNITQSTTLTEYTQTHLDLSSLPYLELTLEVFDDPDDINFTHMKPGNWVLVHASELRLPGGVRGWRGSARILAMVYDEDQNTVLTRLRGTL